MSYPTKEATPAPACTLAGVCSRVTALESGGWRMSGPITAPTLPNHATVVLNLQNALNPAPKAVAFVVFIANQNANGGSAPGNIVTFIPQGATVAVNMPPPPPTPPPANGAAMRGRSSARVLNVALSKSAPAPPPLPNLPGGITLNGLQVTTNPVNIDTTIPGVFMAFYQP